MKRTAAAIVSITIAAGSLVGVAEASAAPALPTAHHFKNCTSLNRVYPHGVGRRHAHDHTTDHDPVTNFYRNNRLYRANRDHDGDGDHIACEEH
jgi:hypothetical protein